MEIHLKKLKKQSSFVDTQLFATLIIFNKVAYTTGAGWLNFFFLATGGSGMPYFSLLSAALSLYFSYKNKKENKLKWIMQSERQGGNTTLYQLEDYHEAKPQSPFSPTLPTLPQSFGICGEPPGFSRIKQWQVRICPLVL